MKSVHPLFNLLIILIVGFSIGLISCKKKSDPDPQPATYFPVLEVSGSHYNIGYAIGKQFQPQIAASFSSMQGLMSLVDDLIAQDSNRFYQCYVDTVLSLYPQFIEELEGMADGSGFPFRNFFIECMIPEYVHLLGLKDDPSVMGCSTVRVCLKI